LIAGRRPRTPSHSVCLDCKRRGTVCIVVAHGVPCLGPVTQTGCGAICPAYDRGCYGCFGPAVQPNLVSLSEQFQRAGTATPDLVRGLRLFNAYAPEFRRESERLASTEKAQP
jgi:coenzyme F420-reducing hydrogenase gamma subunit